MENKTYYLTYVVGERGVGKTTLLAHFATEYMIPPRAITDLSICKKEIERLRAGGWENLSLAPHVQHLVYVVDDTFIARGLGYKPRVSMELQFERIGLYDGVHEVDYLLPYAKIFLPEIQSKLDSRKSMTAERVADYFLRYIERQRKVGVQMWADTQIDDSADKRFRSHFTFAFEDVDEFQAFVDSNSERLDQYKEEYPSVLDWIVGGMIV